MPQELSPKMVVEIQAVVDAANKSARSIRVYAEADRIRQANMADNIALEDIVDAITRLAGSFRCTADPNDARDALLGIVPKIPIGHSHPWPSCHEVERIYNDVWEAAARIN